MSNRYLVWKTGSLWPISSIRYWFRPGRLSRPELRRLLVVRRAAAPRDEDGWLVLSGPGSDVPR